MVCLRSIRHDTIARLVSRGLECVDCRPSVTTSIVCLFYLEHRRHIGDCSRFRESYGEMDVAVLEEMS